MRRANNLDGPVCGLEKCAELSGVDERFTDVNWQYGTAFFIQDHAQHDRGASGIEPGFDPNTLRAKKVLDVFVGGRWSIVANKVLDAAGGDILLDHISEPWVADQSELLIAVSGPDDTMML